MAKFVEDILNGFQETIDDLTIAISGNVPNAKVINKARTESPHIGESPVFVTFQTYDSQSANLNAAVEKAKKKTGEAIEEGGEDLWSFLSRSKNANNISKLGFGDGKQTKLDRAVKLDQTPPVVGRQVRLYIPSQIQYQDGMQYNTVALGSLGAAAEQMFSRGMSVAQAGKKALGAELSLDRLIDGLTADVDGGAAGIAAQRVASKSPIGADKLAGAVSSN